MLEILIECYSTRSTKETWLYKVIAQKKKSIMATILIVLIWSKVLNKN